MIRKFLSFFVVTALILTCSSAPAEHLPGHLQTKEVASGPNYPDVIKHKACPHCGMDREKFAYSRMLVTYSDGSSAGLCSLHCAATELKANKGKAVKAVKVADVNTQKLVDTEKAAWVIGGSRKGVMTMVAKWAFAKKDDAAAFIRKNGGKLAVYKEALALAEKE